MSIVRKVERAMESRRWEILWMLLSFVVSVFFMKKHSDMNPDGNPWINGLIILCAIFLSSLIDSVIGVFEKGKKMGISASLLMMMVLVLTVLFRWAILHFCKETFVFNICVALAFVITTIEIRHNLKEQN